MCATKAKWEKWVDGPNPVLFNFVPVNPFGAGIFFKILAHPVFKMWTLQELKNYEINGILKTEKKTENVQHV